MGIRVVTDSSRVKQLKKFVVFSESNYNILIY